MEAIIIPRKIRIVLPQVLPLRIEMPKAPLLRWVLRLHWSDKTIDNGNKIVIGGAQRKGKFNSKLKGWKLGKDQECWACLQGGQGYG